MQMYGKSIELEKLSYIHPEPKKKNAMLNPTNSPPAGFLMIPNERQPNPPVSNPSNVASVEETC